MTRLLEETVGSGQRSHAMKKLARSPRAVTDDSEN